MERKIHFGLFQPQIGLPFPALKERVLACEEYGFHSVWFTDHMWTRGMPQVDFLEYTKTLSTYHRWRGGREKDATYCCRARQPLELPGSGGPPG